ncbi:amidohydrolase [Agreia sp. Leaf210]|uniref:amidohydrolase n=1 Tax=Agreia sp. Leaf210 TaxID=1735682 RepID=UPI0006FD16A7|nr:amidohydrolase family protein [Agreia sp. Leaf210]KQM60270.1 amidohydrolase [Agreia sp. Leaf210]
MTESVLLTGARLPGGGTAEVSLVDGRIESVSTAGGGSLAASRDAATQIVDLDGRYLIPGLWDKHVHATQWALVSRRLDLSAAASAADAVGIVAERLRRASASHDESADIASDTDAGPLVGYGFRDGLWPDAPHRGLLDAVTGARPVILVSADLHCCWLNSAALAQHGQAEHPTGLLREDDCFAVTRTLGDVETDTLDGWVRDAARAAAARGVVGVVDLEMSWNVEDWTRRIRSGSTELRVRFGIYPQHLDRAIDAGLVTGALIAGTHGLLQVGPFKVITDGSLNTRTAYCFDEYPGLEGLAHSRGQLNVPYDELVPMLRQASQAGLVPAVHAIGDHANTLALDAFERLGVGGSIEHAQLIAEVDVERFARLGVVAGVQPEHAMDDRDVADKYWPGRTGRAFALASLLESGAELALGSDAPVAPLDPWITIAAAVARTGDERAPWHPEQSISVEEALFASADGRRALEPGGPADIAVLEVDPLSASTEELRRMPVAATLLAGRFTHNAL